jgi:hypothetical protein
MVTSEFISAFSKPLLDFFVVILLLGLHWMIKESVRYEVVSIRIIPGNEEDMQAPAGSCLVPRLGATAFIDKRPGSVVPPT